MALWTNCETCLCLYRMAYITLPAAVKLISREIEVFSARRQYDSVHYSDACKAVELGQFKDVSLGSEIMLLQYFEGVLQFHYMC